MVEINNSSIHPEIEDPARFEWNNSPIWKPVYNRNSFVIANQRLDILEKYLDDTGKLSDEVQEQMQVSREFVNGVFANWQSPNGLRDSGSFAFVVPTRIKRGDEEYGAELLPKMPVMEHFGSHTRQIYLSELPPFIIDEYGTDQTGRKGYMVYAPVMADILNDTQTSSFKTLNRMRARGVLKGAISSTAHFVSNNLGVSTVGLGATLPKLTKYGTDFKKYAPHLHVTTGHAATVWLMEQSLRRAIDEGYAGDEDEPLGVIGVGAIGRAATRLMINQGFNPENIKITDHDKKRVQRVAAENPGVTTAENNLEILTDSRNIVSAVTKAISLGHKQRLFEGKFILDDSQPGAFDPREVRGGGGTLAWPIAEDRTPQELVTGRLFDYNGLGPARLRDAWGCLVEACIVAYQPDLALFGREVSDRDVHLIGEKMKEMGIGPAPIQSHGELLDPQLDHKN